MQWLTKLYKTEWTAQEKERRPNVLVLTYYHAMYQILQSEEKLMETTHTEDQTDKQGLYQRKRYTVFITPVPVHANLGLTYSLCKDLSSYVKKKRYIKELKIKTMLLTCVKWYALIHIYWIIMLSFWSLSTSPLLSLLMFILIPLNTYTQQINTAIYSTQHVRTCIKLSLFPFHMHICL